MESKLAQWTTLNRVSIGIGSILWLLTIVFRSLGLLALSDPELILLLAFLVITPLALPLTLQSRTPAYPHRLSSLIIIVQPFAALIGGESLLLSDCPLAAIAAGIWLTLTLLMAMAGVVRLRHTGLSLDTLDDISLAMALIYVPIGGAWFMAARLGIRPLGFSSELVLLTADHFHYIPLAALTLTGLTGRAIRQQQNHLVWTVYRVVAMGMIIYPLLVAAGMTVMQLTGLSLLGTAAALLALNVMALSALILGVVVPHVRPLAAKMLVALSGAAVLFPMGLAGAYAVGNATGDWTITIAQMTLLHGWVNALLFGLCGLVGWRIQSASQSKAVERNRKGAPCESLSLVAPDSSVSH